MSQHTIKASTSERLRAPKMAGAGHLLASSIRLYFAPLTGAISGARRQYAGERRRMKSLEQDLPKNWASYAWSALGLYVAPLTGAILGAGHRLRMELQRAGEDEASSPMQQP